MVYVFLILELCGFRKSKKTTAEGEQQGKHAIYWGDFLSINTPVTSHVFLCNVYSIIHWANCILYFCTLPDSHSAREKGESIKPERLTQPEREKRWSPEKDWWLYPELSNPLWEQRSALSLKFTLRQLHWWALSAKIVSYCISAWPNF